MSFFPSHLLIFLFIFIYLHIHFRKDIHIHKPQPITLLIPLQLLWISYMQKIKDNHKHQLLTTLTGMKLFKWGLAGVSYQRHLRSTSPSPWAIAPNKLYWIKSKLKIKTYCPLLIIRSIYSSYTLYSIIIILVLSSSSFLYPLNNIKLISPARPISVINIQLAEKH